MPHWRLVWYFDSVDRLSLRFDTASKPNLVLQLAVYVDGRQALQSLLGFHLLPIVLREFRLKRRPERLNDLQILSRGGNRCRATLTDGVRRALEEVHKLDTLEWNFHAMLL
jgi:hypothetical protein